MFEAEYEDDCYSNQIQNHPRLSFTMTFHACEPSWQEMNPLELTDYKIALHET